jgi:hypothetical protein
LAKNLVDPELLATVLEEADLLVIYELDQYTFIKLNIKKYYDSLELLESIFKGNAEKIALALICAVYEGERCIYYFRPRNYQIYLSSEWSDVYLDFKTKTGLEFEQNADYIINYDGLHLHIICCGGNILYCDEYCLYYEPDYELIETLASELRENEGGMHIVYSSPATNIKYETKNSVIYVIDGKLMLNVVPKENIVVARRYKYEELSQIMINPTSTAICKHSNRENTILVCMRATFGIARFIYDEYSCASRLIGFYNDSIYSNNSRIYYVADRQTFNSILPSAYDDEKIITFMNMNGDTVVKTLGELTGEDDYHDAINHLWKNPADLKWGDYYPVVMPRNLCVLQYSDIKNIEGAINRACLDIIATFKSLVISFMYVSGAKRAKIRKLAKDMLRARSYTNNQSLLNRIRNKNEAVARFYLHNEDPNTFY